MKHQCGGFEPLSLCLRQGQSCGRASRACSGIGKTPTSSEAVAPYPTWVVPSACWVGSRATWKDEASIRRRNP